MKSAVKIMGILNVTPDSFSDGGVCFSLNKAISRAKEMIKEGADIIDVGGESSGPNSVFVSEEEELKRVIPVIKKIAPICKKHKVLISIDTYKSEVARQAVKAGASIINDVTALRGDPKMAKAAAELNVPIILMYSKDSTARTTRCEKKYKDVVKNVMEFLEKQIKYARDAGIKKENIIIDPGMGAFISAIPEYSFEILRRLFEFKKLGCEILIGTSRKSFLPGTLNQRLIPSLIANMVAVKNGARILRVHDVSYSRKMLS